MRRSLFIENLFRDVRYALRVFAHNPGFSAILILTLALGIGTSTAIFSLVDATLLRPLPYPEADRIAALSEADRGGNDLMVSWPDFVDWRHEARSYTAIAALGGINFNMTGSGEAERLHGLRVSASFLSVLGVHPLLGRDFRGFIAALLFAIQPNDTLTFVAISCLLLAVATLACWLPARRTAAVDPILTLKVDQ